LKTSLALALLSEMATPMGQQEKAQGYMTSLQQWTAPSLVQANWWYVNFRMQEIRVYFLCWRGNSTRIISFYCIWPGHSAGKIPFCNNGNVILIANPSLMLHEATKSIAMVHCSNNLLKIRQRIESKFGG